MQNRAADFSLVQMKVAPRAMPIINPTPRRFWAPAMNVSVKIFSPGRSMIPITSVAAKNKVVISGNHQSRRETPKIMTANVNTNTESTITSIRTA